MGDLESFGNSNTENNVEALNAVAEFINDIFPGHMVQKFALIVETIDEGDRNLFAFTAPGQKTWDTLGLLYFAAEVDGP